MTKRIEEIINDKELLLSNVHPKLIHWIDAAKASFSVPIKGLDLSVIFVIIDGKDFFQVTEEVLEQLQVTKEELFEAALNNALKKGAKVIPLSCMLGEEEVAKKDDMYYVSLGYIGNSYPGSNVMLFPDLFKELADGLGGTDLYVLPASVYEVLVFSADVPIDKESILGMVSTVNGTMNAEEILSNSVYLYKRKENEIVQIKDGGNSTRLITLSDGTSMGDNLLVFKTNAPVEELKELEKQSCQIYINGGSYDDVPIWADVLADKGYSFELVDSHQHINPFGTSSEWLKNEYPEVKELYVIENQPD